MSRIVRVLFTMTPLGVLLCASTQCEWLVNLDRGEVEAGPVVCTICTDLGEGGDDGDADEDGGATADDASDGGATEEAAGGDATVAPAAFTALHPWDGGAEAGCAIGTAGIRLGCATAFPITGNPLACAGFDEAGNGSTSVCKVVCSSGLTCSLAGLSDGTNAVDCSSNCASPEH